MTRSIGVKTAAAALLLLSRTVGAEPVTPVGPEDSQILANIEAHRPGRLARLPADFNARFGATHSDGKYYLTDKPFLIEGAEKLLHLGTRLGKFWFSLDAAPKFYSFNSQWPQCSNLLELAKTEYFQKVWDMPFETILLTASSPVEDGWRTANRKPQYYARISDEYYRLAAFFYGRFRDRPTTVILQNWEGDWMLRGIGKPWNPPPEDWQQRCEQMQRWIAARQAGVTRARQEFAKTSRCVVALAVEVNRVADAWAGIPTVTRNVLPGVEVDLVSYSAYDGINSGKPLRFYKCLQDIKEHARTGQLFGPGAVMVGEYGIPENDRPDRIAERCDEMLGVMLAMNVRFAAHWELYCNEFSPKIKPPPVAPIKDASLMRGYWLVKPDGSLSETGKYFQTMWLRADAEKKSQAAHMALPVMGVQR